MIFGLTGKNAAGKGEIASYLGTKGFIYLSLSDELREEATKRGLDHSRDSMISLGNELRKELGPQYLAKKANEKIKKASDSNHGKNFVVDSIRNPYEIKELMKNKDFVLVGVEAPIELRFQRLRERNRLGDAKTLEELESQEKKENTGNKTNKQLDATFGLAGKIIINDSSLEKLHKKIDELLVNSAKYSKI